MPPSKTISIPPNPSARRGKPALPKLAAGHTVDTGEYTPGPKHRPAGPVRLAPVHRYRVGERLRMTHGGNIIARQGGGCKVVSLVPHEGYGPMLYRVRSETESFERIVAEADLTRD